MPTASYPAIGIRPLIDGRRRGVRESLEDKTAQLAKDVAELISSRLTYPDGSPVRCVVSETAIGGVAEANRCKEQFRTENVCADLTVTASWNYITEVLDLDPGAAELQHRPGGAGRGEEPHGAGGEVALLEQGAHDAAHLAGGAHDGHRDAVGGADALVDGPAAGSGVAHRPVPP